MDKTALVDVVLVHWPVVNRIGEIIGSAVTNLDLHDIARACKTYGVRKYWVITPYDEQQQLVAEILDHWTNGYGRKADSDRSAALALISVCPDIQSAVQKASEELGEEPLLVATAAAASGEDFSFEEARKIIWAGKPMMLFFGTAWGLAPEVLEQTHAVLPGIRGRGEFNHLSVRSAVSIILDRLLATREVELASEDKTINQY